MHLLIKFTPKLDYARSFQQGKLYMNTLNYFWTNGFEEQRDVLEGVAAKTSPDNLDFLPEDLRSVQYTDIQIQAVGYRYCNVFCMHRIDLKPLGKSPLGTEIAYETASNIEKFGAYAVIVDDEAELLRRINRAANEQQFKYLCGKVNYHKPILNKKPVTSKPNIILKCDETVDMGLFGTEGRYRDSFDKYDKYSWQNEWRLTLYRGVSDINAYQFNIGDLSDITHIVKTKNLEKKLHKEIQNPKLFNSNESYYGNASRKELYGLFAALGDNQAWLIISVG